MTTADIPRWYEMIDALAEHDTTVDSLATIKQEYLSRASPGLKLFAKANNVNPRSILAAVRAYPNYYADIRADALLLDEHSDSIRSTLQRVAELIPEFKIPPVTIAFGVMNSGGTARRGHLLLGAGMNLARASTNVSELSDWHVDNIVPTSDAFPDFRAMVAHEAIHTHQGIQWGWASLENQVLYEGVCDFVVYDLLGYTPDAPHHQYGVANECAVWQDFVGDVDGPRPKRKLPRWLYGGEDEELTRPADLGYFVGRRIAASYHESAADKTTALNTLMRPSRYRAVYRNSQYKGGCP